MTSWYFGCRKGICGDTQAGHYLYDINLRQVSRNLERELPFSYTILDCALLPPVNNDQDRVYGRVQTIHFTGFNKDAAHYVYTVITFWDSTGDTRPGSCSAFIFDEHLSPTDAIDKARIQYPTLFKRFEAAGMAVIP